MSIGNAIGNSPSLIRTVAATPQMLKVDPSVLRFMSNYMNKFRIKRVGGNLILHSHLPPLNSSAYSRFVKTHLLGRTPGPSHAQIAITNACPQNCEYCYNRGRTGEVMDTATIKNSIAALKSMGVVWLGLTGGEPLLQKDIVDIVRFASSDCAVKLFTTGCTLTPEKARALKEAGLFSVCVSLDSQKVDEHDASRGYKGAFEQALKAIEMFRSVEGLHIAVSAVVSRQMIVNKEVDGLLRFLKGLRIDEAWLSEVKPTIPAFRRSELIIKEEERCALVELQNRYNSRGGMTVNYLGHFEGRECFGCNAGRKMVYIDAFGEVSPCVFVPMSFGNVRKASLSSIVSEMASTFPSEDTCFINKNFGLLDGYSSKPGILDRQDSMKMIEKVRFGGLSKFNSIYFKGKKPVEKSTPAASMERQPV